MGIDTKSNKALQSKDMSNPAFAGHHLCAKQLFIDTSNRPLEVSLGEYLVQQLAQINGAFLFVHHDLESDTWFFARDRFGIVPLYYSLDESSPRISDSLKKLLHGSSAKPKFREDMLEVYLSYSYLPGEDTFFEGIQKALPGYLYLYQKGRLTKERYFTPTYAFENDKSLEEWSQELKRVLDDIFSQEEGGTAALLSSGVDSNYLCARLHPQKTYTATYLEKHASEAEQAKEYAASMGVRNKQILVTPDDFFNLVGDAQEALEQPTGDASAVVLLALAKEMAKEQDSCYSGEGIDELFMGYYYRDLGEISPETTLEEAEYLGCVQAFFEEEKQQLLRNYAGTKKMECTKEAYELSAGAPRIDRAALVDMLVWMNGNLLPNLYCIGAASGLEFKTPYLDNRLWDISLRIPHEFKHSDAQTKILFRKAAQEVLGAAALQPKRGFPTPITLWLKQPEYAKQLNAAFTSPTAERFFNIDWILDKYNDFLQDTEDYLSWRPFWCIYCFIVWYDRMERQDCLERNLFYL